MGTTETLSVRLRGAARPDTKGRASAILLLKEIAGVWVMVSAIMVSVSVANVCSSYLIVDFVLELSGARSKCRAPAPLA